MPIEILVPRLGWSMETGAFVAWLKREGERVRPGDPLFTLEGDKAMQDIESLDEGVLRIAPGAPQPGQAIRVGQLLGYLLLPGETGGGTPSEVSPTPEPSAVEPTKSVSAVAVEVPTAPALRASTSVEALDRPLAISPRARRVADELGVDWTRVSGTGRGGRIRERDVRAVPR